MPNRILKESICTSDTLDQLKPAEENFFYRLMVNCDDFGRMDARPAILRSRLYPLKVMTDKQVEDTLKALQAVGIVEVYVHKGRPYLQLLTWDKHQQIRAKRSKYPEPDESDIICNQLISEDCKCPRNPIQSNPNLNPNPNICAEQAPAPQPVITLSLNDNSEYPVIQTQVDEWAALYPAIDVMQQLRNMKGWLKSNPTKRKTRGGILRFITNWLAKEQDRGRASPVSYGNQNIGAKPRYYERPAENYDHLAVDLFADEKPKKSYTREV